MAFQIYKTELGPVTIAEVNGCITEISFGKTSHCDPPKETALLQEAHRQLTEYLSGERKEFSLPLALHGTSFQQEVWAALQKIPYGETVCYQDIARAIGKETVCRAVGMAIHRNPISIVVPCHRVIGKHGALTGYAAGLNFKQQLLNLEQSYK